MYTFSHRKVLNYDNKRVGRKLFGGHTYTDKGMEIAQKIYERHQVIAKALIALGVDEETAYDDSCKIEHDLSDITFQKIKEYFLSHTNENI